MDQVSIVKRQVRTKEWRKRIKECQASGIPVIHWCKQNEEVCGWICYEWNSGRKGRAGERWR